jgi:hypothetical protein
VVVSQFASGPFAATSTWKASRAAQWRRCGNNEPDRIREHDDNDKPVAAWSCPNVNATSPGRTSRSKSSSRTAGLSTSHASCSRLRTESAVDQFLAASAVLVGSTPTARRLRISATPRLARSLASAARVTGQQVAHSCRAVFGSGSPQLRQVRAAGAALRDCDRGRRFVVPARFEPRRRCGASTESLWRPVDLRTVCARRVPPTVQLRAPTAATYRRARRFFDRIGRRLRHMSRAADPPTSNRHVLVTAPSGAASDRTVGGSHLCSVEASPSGSRTEPRMAYFSPWTSSAATTANTVETINPSRTHTRLPRRRITTTPAFAAKCDAGQVENSGRPRLQDRDWVCCYELGDGSTSGRRICWREPSIR